MSELQHNVVDENCDALVEQMTASVLELVEEKKQLRKQNPTKYKYDREYLLHFQNVAISRPEIFQLLWQYELVRGLPMSPRSQAPPLYAAVPPFGPPYSGFNYKSQQNYSHHNQNYPNLGLQSGQTYGNHGQRYFGQFGNRQSYLPNPRPPKRVHNHPPPAPPGELTEHKIEQRQKQIEFGYRSIGYIRYISLVPKSQRTPDMPQTPKVDKVVSKRIWDNEVRAWRRALHKWDPDEELNFVPDEVTLRKIFGDDIDIKEAIQLLHEKELEYKNQLRAGNLDGEDMEEQALRKKTPGTLGYDVRGMPIRYVPGKAAEAAKKVEWHASKAKKVQTTPISSSAYPQTPDSEKPSPGPVLPIPVEKEKRQDEEIPTQ